ncbi:MAG: hypothetical protein LBU32_07300 [Clostridiales bacterium]|nr:hypothetical protein [Clostridiales bacterium]
MQVSIFTLAKSASLSVILCSVVGALISCAAEPINALLSVLTTLSRSRCQNPQATLRTRCVSVSRRKSATSRTLSPIDD